MTLGAAYHSRSPLAAVGLAVALHLGVPGVVAAQSPVPGVQSQLPAGKMLLEADQLLYDFDAETVSAVGGVEIYYGAYVLQASQVTYHQRSGRLIASGGVRLLEPSGNVITAESIDITDDFRDGFVGSLNVRTIDRATFAAQSAERRDGNLTIFRKGVYTACQACLDHPERPPLWQIKASTITHDQRAQTVYYENARLEFFGVPIAYLPYFFHPDPTVRRKTGFLTPTLRIDDSTGVGVSTPFFWNLSPNYDLTFTPTFLTRQGVLMDGEFRHRIMNGAYAIRVAGILQQDPDVFSGESGDRDFRGSIRTTAEFALNSRWDFGWNLNLSTDRLFNRDYDISGADARDLTSTVYLTGLNGTNYFDARLYYFNVQREDREEDFDEDGIVDYVHDDQAEQAIVHPVIDHNYILDNPLFGGRVRFDTNLTSLSRDETDIANAPAPFADYFAGIAGTSTRVTTRATWESRLIGPLGQVFSPFAYLQADANWLSPDDSAPGLSDEELLARAMPAVGLEYEWPFLVTAGSTVHTIGPRAQIVVRPDEQHVGELPNEDAQSLVFDDTTLFLRDKFSGYDRQEGGTRANVALAYQGVFPNGASVDALVGQSYQLAGDNSFAVRDHALTGLGSGLEDDVSDYVARVTLNTGTGIAITARGRLDEADLSLNRGEINAIAGMGRNLASVSYAMIRESPASGIFEDREEISGGAVIALDSNWSVLGSMVYDMENNSKVSQSIGLAYDDECFALSVVYSEKPDRYTDLETEQEFFVRINLRTLGDNQVVSPLDD